LQNKAKILSEGKNHGLQTINGLNGCSVVGGAAVACLQIFQPVL